MPTIMDFPAPTLSAHRQRKGSAPFARWWLAFLALPSFLGIVACTEAPTAPLPRYQDFIAQEGLTTSSGKAPGIVFCSEETWTAFTLAAGERITVEVEPGEGTTLTLTGCNPRVQKKEDQPLGRLRLVADGSGGEAVAEVEVPFSKGWWRQEAQLAALTQRSGAGDTVTLHLEAELPEGHSVYLRDFHLRAEKQRPFETATGPQILLISIDALRADVLGPYGGEAATPNLDRLASEAQVWTRHYAAATWTKPSHAAMLTGAPPDVAPSTESVLAEDITTLAERFTEAGLATAGLVYDCVWLNPKFGLHRGFQEYWSVPWRMPRQVREAVNWLGDHRSEPFFFFFHTFEVHSDFRALPYEAPGISQGVVERRFGVPRYGCTPGFGCASGRLKRIRLGEVEPVPGEEEILRFLYVKSVEFMDEQIGILLDELRRAGLYDDLMIVFTSDHGESLFDHGDLLHSFVWEEVLRVPLIIKWPQGRHAGEVQDLPSASIDLAPTLLEEASIEAKELMGSHLLRRRRDFPVIAGTTDKVVIRENLKAIFQKRQQPPLLYDLATDPGETTNLAPEQPETVARMKQLLDDFNRAYELRRKQNRPGADGTNALTEEEAERLRSLGYLGD